MRPRKRPPTIPRSTWNQGADRGEQLIAKAREEGTLTLHTSMATTESGPLALAFEKKYGVKVQVWRALSDVRFWG